MLSKKNLVLILNTNILKDAIDMHQSDNLKRALQGWAARIVQNMTRNPKGKTVTLVASTHVLKDYQSGLGRSGYGPAGKIFADYFAAHLSRKMPINEDKSAHLTFFKIPPVAETGNTIRDRDDRKFLTLVNQTLTRRQLNDRFIIFATRDAPTRHDMEAALPEQGRRVSVEGSVPDLERAIEC